MVGFEKYIREDSGWILKTVLQLNIHTVLYKPYVGSSFTDLPASLKKSRTLLNIRNDDEKCFIYCVIAAIFPIPNVTNLDYNKQFESHLNMNNIKFPVPLSSMDKFERQNQNVSVNVFGFEKGEIYPLKITKQKGCKHHVNLLYLQNVNTSHYCLIKNLDGFLFERNPMLIDTIFVIFA